MQNYASVSLATGLEGHSSVTKPNGGIWISADQRYDVVWSNVTNIMGWVGGWVGGWPFSRTRALLRLERTVNLTWRSNDFLSLIK